MKSIAIVFLVGALAAPCWGCDEQNGPAAAGSSSTTVPSLDPIKGLPSDFFPMTVGKEWAYKIELGPAEPLRYSEITWPLGDGGVTYAVRSRFVSAVRDEKQKTFHLRVRVKQKAPAQGPLKYREGVELEVVTDELGVFDEAKQLFFAASAGSRYMAKLVVTYSPDKAGAPSGPWGSWGQTDGHSTRLIFFGDKPGLEIGLGAQPRDKLLFVGIDRKVPGHTGAPLLHFVRTVSSNEQSKRETSSDILDKGFTEDTWFAQGSGMIRLEQKVEKTTSMVWRLD